LLESLGTAPPWDAFMLAPHRDDGAHDHTSPLS
jgi:hypothetical protein